MVLPLKVWVIFSSGLGTRTTDHDRCRFSPLFPAIAQCCQRFGGTCLHSIPEGCQQRSLRRNASDKVAVRAIASANLRSPLSNF
ncbi:hypothetical protein [Laspinema olomoucense]|uniref:Secreted protein n=1 Tax=Laspinema olomoucense D3b TaxID=2953688 RepID=A0ABT2N9Z1_9CYAN|nr:hypothetical protein [Laspinema sp. D3b]MCT7979507.1 hypothetical protein [Laspinema sp. D3b]